jgi:hypothetical protein
VKPEGLKNPSVPLELILVLILVLTVVAIKILSSRIMGTARRKPLGAKPVSATPTFSPAQRAAPTEDDPK